MIKIKTTANNECFKWCLVIYSHPADNNPKKIRTFDKVFARVLDFKYIKCPDKVLDINKKKKKRIALALVFLVMTIRRKYQIYIAKKYFQETY